MKALRTLLLMVALAATVTCFAKDDPLRDQNNNDVDVTGSGTQNGDPLRGDQKEFKTSAAQAKSSATAKAEIKTSTGRSSDWHATTPKFAMSHRRPIYRTTKTILRREIMPSVNVTVNMPQQKPAAQAAPTQLLKDPNFDGINAVEPNSMAAKGTSITYSHNSNGGTYLNIEPAGSNPSWLWPVLLLLVALVAAVLIRAFGGGNNNGHAIVAYPPMYPGYAPAPEPVTPVQPVQTAPQGGVATANPFGSGGAGSGPATTRTQEFNGREAAAVANATPATMAQTGTEAAKTVATTRKTDIKDEDPKYTFEELHKLFVKPGQQPIPNPLGEGHEEERKTFDEWQKLVLDAKAAEAKVAKPDKPATETKLAENTTPPANPEKAFTLEEWERIGKIFNGQSGGAQPRSPRKRTDQQQDGK